MPPHENNYNKHQDHPQEDKDKQNQDHPQEDKDKQNQDYKNNSQPNTSSKNSRINVNLLGLGSGTAKDLLVFLGTHFLTH
jgi:hypothetical protein